MKKILLLLMTTLPLAAENAASLSWDHGEAHTYRATDPEPVRLYVFKPPGWKADDRRTGFVFFFPGGWAIGKPQDVLYWADFAVRDGMVAILPDYRTKTRFGATPLDSVADGRAALRWVQDHAAELGIDPKKIVVGGISSGGHLALWTAITKTPPGSNPQEAPKEKPASLFVICPCSDTSPDTGFASHLFGTHGEALSPLHHLDNPMPPVLLIHGDADAYVPYRQSVALAAKLKSGGGICEFISVPGGLHPFLDQMREWRGKCYGYLQKFLAGQEGKAP